MGRLINSRHGGQLESPMCWQTKEAGQENQWKGQRDEAAAQIVNCSIQYCLTKWRLAGDGIIN